MSAEYPAPKAKLRVFLSETRQSMRVLTRGRRVRSAFAWDEANRILSFASRSRPTARLHCVGPNSRFYNAGDLATRCRASATVWPASDMRTASWLARGSEDVDKTPTPTSTARIRGSNLLLFISV